MNRSLLGVLSFVFLSSAALAEYPVAGNAVGYPPPGVANATVPPAAPVVAGGGVVVAGATAINPAFQSPLLNQPMGSQFPGIYGAMVSPAVGFLNGAGHTFAAAKLTYCLVEADAMTRAQSLKAMVGALSTSRLAWIQQSFRRTPWPANSVMSTLAAQLLCKRGARTNEQMVEKLDATYVLLTREGRLLKAEYQVFVAAELMQ